MNFQEAEDIPGMIELVERKMLYVSVQSLSLEDGDNIIEFGPFFGRSTNCIAQGLKNNKTFSHNCRFLTYDSFHCNVNGWFAPHVLRAAESGGVTDMLETKNDRINFEPIFNYYMKNYHWLVENTTLTFKQILEFLLVELKSKRLLLSISFSMAKKIAFILEKMPFSILTMDQVEMLKTDSVMSKNKAYTNFFSYEASSFYIYAKKQSFF